MSDFLGNDVGRAQFTGNVCVNVCSGVFSLLVFGVAERKRNIVRRYSDSVHTAGSEDNLLFMKIVLAV